MPDYKLRIKGTFDNKQLVKALKQAGVNVDQLKKQTKQAEEGMGGFRGATAGLRRSIGALRNNLLLVTFTLGGVGAAITKATRDFAKFEQVSQGFRELGRNVGFSSEALNQLTRATNGAVSEIELMRQANNAMLLGIVDSEEQMAEMFDMAQRLAAAVGKDATFGIESLTTGIGRQSRLMLDNLGIIVRSEEAYKAYAKQINKNVSDLTDQERKTAFINAAMDSARDKVKKLGEEQMTTAMSLESVSSSMTKVSTTLGKLFSPLIKKSAEQFVGAAEAVNKYLDSLRDLENAEIRETGNLERLQQEAIKTRQAIGQIEEKVREMDEAPWVGWFDHWFAPDQKDLDDAREKLKLLEEQILTILFPKLPQEGLSPFQQILLDNDNLQSYRY